MLLSSAHSTLVTASLTATAKKTTTQTATPGIVYAGSHAATAAGTPGFTPAQIKTAYGIGSITYGSVVGDGTGQTVAIVDAYNNPNIVGDLGTFSTTFGLPTATLIRLNENGGSTLPGIDPLGQWGGEIALDVEWVHAIAPGATIVLVEATSDSFPDLLAAEDTARNYPGVSVITNSWGGQESSSDLAFDRYFTTPAGHTQEVFTASTGDDGAYNLDDASARIVNYPAASANVLAVGGTSLTLNSDGTYQSESGWGSGSGSAVNGGGGGGVSVLIAQPVWQEGVVTQSLTKRTLPDVSIVADPNTGVVFLDSFDDPSSPWGEVGGTSLSSPVWAAMVAIADQGRAINDLNNLSTLQLHTYLYSASSADFHDITTGSNGYSASAGYDLVTGLGTPLANVLIPFLATDATAIGSTTAPTIGAFTATPATIVPGQTITMTASNVTDTDNTIVSVDFYLESNSTTGLQVGSDTLLAQGTQSGLNWSAAAQLPSLPAGSYTLYAIATDSDQNVSTVLTRQVTISITVNQTITGNDNFANAGAITGTNTSVGSSNVGATAEKGEKKILNIAGGASIWFTWTAAVTGKVELNTAGSTFDTLLAVYTGTQIGKLKAVAANDDDEQDFLITSALTFNAVAGTSYSIEVDGYALSQGTVILNLAQSVAPANDNFSAATVVSGDTFTWAGTNDGATLEKGEPKIANVTGGSSVWLAWTATSSETVTLSTAGSNFDTLLGVYTGKKVSGLKKIGSNDNGPGVTTSAVTLKVKAGTTYYFDVDGVDGVSGNILLGMSPQLAPA